MGQLGREYIMPFPCGVSIYITEEAATLIGLTIIVATFLLITTSMAKKRRSGGSVANKSPLASSEQQAQVAGPSASGPQTPAVTAPQVPKQTDSRPATSPYGSEPCQVPFASPLTVPKDILLRSPRLTAAYENQLPELPEIPDDVGHILAHFLHTGTYESLRPKETDPLARQTEELRTSIRAYSAARAYELPKLMRLAEKRIEKYGDGLSLPSLLEVTKDAHPTLTETDTWFLNYLKTRIRPHLKDPKVLLGSNLLDQISSILSPNPVLLRTVLEMFCERMEDRREGPVLESQPAVVAPPSPPATPSVLQIRSRTIPRTDSPPQRKRSVTPWPSADEATPEPSPKPRKQSLAEPIAREPILSEPVLAEPAPIEAVETQIQDAIDADIKPTVVNINANPWALVAAPTTPVRQVRSIERHDSAKYIPATPELDVGAAVKPLETPSGAVSDPTPSKMARSHPPLLREVDSGFWDFEQDSAKRSLASSVMEIEPEYVDVKTPAVHELHTEAPQQEGGAGVHTRDFATPEPATADAKGKAVEQEAPLAPEVSSKDPLDAFPEGSESEVLSDSKLLDRIAEEDEAKAPESAAKVESPAPHHAVSESGLTFHEPVTDIDAHPIPEPLGTASVHGLPDHAEPLRPADAEAAESKPSPVVAEPAGEPAVQDEQSGGVPNGPAEPRSPRPVGAPVSGAEHPAQKDVVVEPEAGPSPGSDLPTPERQKSWRKRLSLRLPVRFGRSG